METPEERNKKFTEAKRRSAAEDPRIVGLPQLLILPDADVIARRIMLEELRQELIQDDRPGGIRVKRPEIWKIWAEGMKHWVREHEGRAASVAAKEEAMRLIEEAGDTNDLAVTLRNVVDLLEGRFTPD